MNNCDVNLEEDLLNFTSGRVNATLDSLKKDWKYKNLSKEVDDWFEKITEGIERPFLLEFEARLDERKFLEMDMCYAQGLKDGFRLKDMLAK